MGVPIQAGDLAAQHPTDMVLYRFIPFEGDLEVSRVRPPGDAQELTVERFGVDGVRISGGIPGANYEVAAGEQAFSVRVTTKGLFRTARDAQGEPVLDGLGKPTLHQTTLGKGEVLVKRATGVTERHVLGTTQPQGGAPAAPPTGSSAGSRTVVRRVGGRMRAVQVEG